MMGAQRGGLSEVLISILGVFGKMSEESPVLSYRHRYQDLVGVPILPNLTAIPEKFQPGFIIEPGKVFGYTCEILYEDKRRFEK